MVVGPSSSAERSEFQFDAILNNGENCNGILRSPARFWSEAIHFGEFPTRSCHLGRGYSGSSTCRLINKLFFYSFNAVRPLCPRSQPSRRRALERRRTLLKIIQKAGRRIGQQRDTTGRLQRIVRNDNHSHPSSFVQL